MVLAKHKKALFNYEILEKLEAGIALSGAEVKSVKLKQISLKGSFVTFTNDEPFLVNAYITPYKTAKKSQVSYNPERKRKLLMHKKEINRLRGKIEAEGLTITPISVYTKNNLIKVEIGLARGKKKYEKRETIKKRDIDRRIKERMKRI